MATTALINQRLAESSSVLTWGIEECGFGAMVSRIMTGLGIALTYGLGIKPVMAGCRYQFPFDLPTFQKEITDLKPFRFSPGEKVPSTGYEWRFFEYYGQPMLTKQFQYPAPPEWAGSPGRHHWCACLMSYIAAHANVRLLECVNDAKQRLNWSDHPIKVGLHIRRGDKYLDNPNVPLQVYYNYMKQLMDRLGDPAVIYLTTDDPDIHQQITRDWPWQVIYDTTEQRYNDANWIRVRQSPEMAEQESYTAAKNILLLGDCDYVMGNHNTQFTWLGGLLCVARNHFDTERHIMIHAKTHELSHWAADFGWGCTPPNL